jgi:heme/copper-type cytochrome/quinol oxidase subunit 1
MIDREHFRSPAFLFFIAAVCLVPLGLLTFHSDWPPLDWKHTHFADASVGQSFLVCSGIFSIIAIVYFYFPQVLHRRMNALLGQLHFWANVFAMFLLLLIPIYFNLTFDSPAQESKVERFFEHSGVDVLIANRP